MARMVNGKPVAVGRHSTGQDYEKLNWAAILGYRVIRVTPQMVKSGEAVRFIEAAIERQEDEE